MAKRSYSDSEKAEYLAALDANGGNVARTAKQLSIADSTLREWSKNRFVSDEIADIREQKKVELADKLDAIAHAIADGMPDKIEGAGLKDAAIALGTVIDKRRLLLGESTVITETLSGDREFAEEQLAELMRDFKLTRKEALELARTHAPTIVKWLM